MAFTENNPKSPDQIWSWIQMSLRADMPRANYDTWVQPARAISFENDRFLVGCYNDYGRCWLESRLTTLIRRMVECEVGRPVQVDFILLHQEPAEDDDSQREEEGVDGETDELIVCRFMPLYETRSWNQSGLSKCRFISSAGCRMSVFARFLR